jgi:hypothetical protein
LRSDGPLRRDLDADEVASRRLRGQVGKDRKNQPSRAPSIKEGAEGSLPASVSLDKHHTA